MLEPTWLVPDRLASFNNDTFRAELSPRRVAPDGENGFKIVTPEEAKEIEQRYMADWQKAIKADIAANGKPGNKAAARDRADAVKPDKKKYVFVDAQARLFPKVWKLYELRDKGEVVMEKDDAGKLQPALDEDGNQIKVMTFVRVGEVDTIIEALPFVPEVS